MPRAATLAESLPPVVPAPPDVADAIEAFLRAEHAAWGAGWLSEPYLAREAAWNDLEALVLKRPRAWFVHAGSAWGVMKKSKRGLELVRRDPARIRQAPNEQGDRR